MRPLLRISFYALIIFTLIYSFFHFYLPTSSHFYSLPTQTSTKTNNQTKIQATETATPPTHTPATSNQANRQSSEDITKKPKSIIYYTVQAGDTLSKIANIHNLTVQDLVQANLLINPDYIEAGQVLLIDTKPITEPTPNDKGKQIIVILSKQTVYTYQDGELINSFLISSGIASYPTVIGNYKIERKYEYDDMTGPGYYIEDVPWVTYFHLGYSFHGTTWHDNFGSPMSHGCLNMTVDDAKWLYHWAPIGTPVQIIP